VIVSGWSRLFVGLTIATFLGFFLIEAVVWRWPLTYQTLLPQLNPGLTISAQTQARVLQALFVNQGVYNLMVAAGGIAGWLMVRRGRIGLGRSFVLQTCLFGVGAALTLLATTHAYALGLFQLVCPGVALALLWGDREPG
jgi:putative membrane protein